MFLDEATIEVRSGKGGDGSASFHREKHVPRGGPDGGDGGKGGDIVFVADAHMRTLLDFRQHRKFRADDGAPGGSSRKFGKSAKSLTIRVPVGTQIRDAQTGEVLTDLTSHKAKWVALRGGRGGRGNLHYVSSVRQAPTFAEKGEPAREQTLKLELKLMADVGLVGLPNAGKSTLISAVSAAKPKIANYPFTTLVPNLGIVRAGEQSFVMADLPGLIEGASEGKGLGHRFLKHADRTRIIVHVVEAAPIDGTLPIDNYQTVVSELEAYSDELGGKPSVIVLSKIDLITQEEREAMQESLQAFGPEVFPLSAATGVGLEKLVFHLAAMLEAMPIEDVVHVIEPVAEPSESFEVSKVGTEFLVQGDAVVRAVAMTNLDNQEAIRHLHRKLKAKGVIEQLREAGVQDGDTVRIGAFAFTYLEEE